MGSRYDTASEQRSMVMSWDSGLGIDEIEPAAEPIIDPPAPSASSVSVSPPCTPGCERIPTADSDVVEPCAALWPFASRPKGPARAEPKADPCIESKAVPMPWPLKDGTPPSMALLLLLLLLLLFAL